MWSREPAEISRATSKLLRPSTPLGPRGTVRSMKRSKFVIVADDLVEEIYITYSWTHVPGHAHGRLMRPANLFPRRSMRVELPDAIVELVRAKFGISIPTRWAVAQDIADGRLVGLPITDRGVTIAWSAVVRDADGAASTAHRLAATLARWARDDAGGSAAE